MKVTHFGCWGVAVAQGFEGKHLAVVVRKCYLYMYLA